MDIDKYRNIDKINKIVKEEDIDEDVKKTILTKIEEDIDIDYVDVDEDVKKEILGKPSIKKTVK